MAFGPRCEHHSRWKPYEETCEEEIGVIDSNKLARWQFPNSLASQHVDLQRILASRILFFVADLVVHFILFRAAISNALADTLSSDSTVDYKFNSSLDYTYGLSFLIITILLLFLRSMVDFSEKRGNDVSHFGGFWTK